jgi:hypothetical protein
MLLKKLLTQPAPLLLARRQVKQDSSFMLYPSLQILIDSMVERSRGLLAP